MKAKLNIYSLVVLFILCLSTVGFSLFSDSKYKNEREGLIREIKRDVRDTSALIGKTKLNTAVMEAMATVPRHEFVPHHQKEYAYENRPLSIGYGQTISQPYIVALMSDLLDVSSEDRVLEVGTGSAYQAAILAELVKEVYTIEIIPQLAYAARKRLERLEYENVTVKVGDGYYGLEEHAPFDAIIVTAAGSHVPPPLIEQLKEGGKMVIPVGGPFFAQHLLLITKKSDGSVTSKNVLPVRFVPLTGNH